MSLFTHTYSGIITRGLGLPACCGIITASFGLMCGCTIEVIIPPAGGGGGSFVSPSFLVPFPENMKKCDRIILITVKFSEKNTWRKQFMVDVCNADKIVKVINIVNNMKDKISVGIDKIKQITRIVTTKF